MIGRWSENKVSGVSDLVKEICFSYDVIYCARTIIMVTGVFPKKITNFFPLNILRLLIIQRSARGLPLVLVFLSCIYLCVKELLSV